MVSRDHRVAGQYLISPGLPSVVHGACRAGVVPRYGYRCRTDGHKTDQAARVCRSSFYCGVAGAMAVFRNGRGGGWHRILDPAFFVILFIVIIGGLGSLIGSFLGAALLVAIPGLPAIGIPLTGANASTSTR